MSDDGEIIVRIANTPAEIFRDEMEPLPNSVNIEGDVVRQFLRITTNGPQAFVTPNGARELARVLCECADRLEAGK